MIAAVTRARTAILVVSLVTVVAIATYALPIQQWTSDLAAWIRDAGAAGVLVYAAAYIAGTVLLVPGWPLTVVAGFVYGPLLGTALVSPVSVTAATVAFLLGRTLLRQRIARRLAADRRLAALDAAVAEQGFKVVALVRLSPLLPFDILNYAFGLTRVRLRDYVLGSFVGMLPGTVMYVYLGSLATQPAELSAAADADVAARQVLYWAGLAATVLVTIYVTRLARTTLRQKYEVQA